MPEYRRHYVEGTAVFFTVVTHQRRKLFDDERARACLHQAIDIVRRETAIYD